MTTVGNLIADLRAVNPNARVVLEIDEVRSIEGPTVRHLIAEFLTANPNALVVLEIDDVRSVEAATVDVQYDPDEPGSAILHAGICLGDDPGDASAAP